KRLDRAPGPRDHDAGRLIERTVDDRRVALSGNNTRIPPSGDLLGLEQPHKPLHRLPILPLVTDKDVSHLPWSLLSSTVQTNLSNIAAPVGCGPLKDRVGRLPKGPVCT